MMINFLWQRIYVLIFILHSLLNKVNIFPVIFYEKFSKYCKIFERTVPQSEHVA